MKQKEIVRRGYDKVSYAYGDETGAGDFTTYDGRLRELSALLPENSPVPDLGCSLPVTQMLSEKFVVNGVDISL